MKHLPRVELAIAIIASLVFVAVIGFVDLGWPEFQLAEETQPGDAPAMTDANKDLPELDPCELGAARFLDRLEASRVCDAGTDCAVVNFGCQLGCTTTVHNNRIGELSSARDAFQQDCHLCLERCPEPVFEWRAACVRNRCILLDPSIEDLEEETMRRIEASD